VVCSSKAFRVIANALIRASFVGTIDNYVDIIAAAWDGERQYVQVLSAVHDYAAWLKGTVWQTSHSSDKDVNSLVRSTPQEEPILRHQEACNRWSSLLVVMQLTFLVNCYVLTPP
jgi:hypothetical protein